MRPKRRRLACMGRPRCSSAAPTRSPRRVSPLTCHAGCTGRPMGHWRVRPRWRHCARHWQAPSKPGRHDRTVRSRRGSGSGLAEPAGVMSQDVGARGSGDQSAQVKISGSVFGSPPCHAESKDSDGPLRERRLTAGRRAFAEVNEPLVSSGFRAWTRTGGRGHGPNEFPAGRRHVRRHPGAQACRPGAREPDAGSRIPER